MAFSIKDNIDMGQNKYANGDMEQKEYPVVVGYLELEMSPLEAIVLCRGCELPQKKDEEAVEKEEDTSTVLEN